MEHIEDAILDIPLDEAWRRRSLVSIMGDDQAKDRYADYCMTYGGTGAVRQRATTLIMKHQFDHRTIGGEINVFTVIWFSVE